MRPEGGRVVIVGAGHAGGSASAFLRQLDHSGEIELIGEEPVGPYHRPPLSKKFVTGEPEQPLKPAGFYVDQNISLRTGVRVDALHPSHKQIALGDGSTVDYDALILATGSVNRRLNVPGAELAGIHQLRTLADAQALKAEVTPGCRLVIVGGGYIGLEVAAAAGREGIAVKVIEREERVLARVGSPELSDFLTRLHRRQGTEILTCAHVEAFEADDAGGVAGVRLSDGSVVPCDCVLVGIGAVANDGLARAAVLECDNGIVVDANGATSAPGIWAVGDVTSRHVDGHAGRFRLESIPSAVEQARHAAAAIVGAPAPHAEVPWFWSEQFGLKLQICGLLDGADTVTVRGDPVAGTFALFHTAGRRLIAVEAVNSPRDFMAGKSLIRDAAELDLERLGDGEVSLKEVMAL